MNEPFMWRLFVEVELYVILCVLAWTTEIGDEVPLIVLIFVIFITAVRGVST